MVREIINKQLQKALKREGINDVHLYKECTFGFFYVLQRSINYNETILKDNIIYLNSFSQQGIKDWVNDIKQILGKTW